MTKFTRAPSLCFLPRPKQVCEYRPLVFNMPFHDSSLLVRMHVNIHQKLSVCMYTR